MKRLLFLLTATLLLAGPLHAQSVRYFLEFISEGAGASVVKGTSVTVGYVDQVEVVSWNISAENPVVIGSTAGGAGAGKFSSENGIDLIMQLDPIALPPLLKTMANGGHWQKVILRGVRFNGGQPAVKFLEVDLRLVYLDNFNQQGTNGDSPICNMRIKFGAISLTTWNTKPDGSTVAVAPFIWSIIKNNATLDVN